jgi:acetyl esterase
VPLDPQCAALLNQMAEAGGPPPETVSVEDNRALIAAIAELSGPPADLARVEDVNIPGPAGDIPARIYVPNGAGPFPVLVFFHGGGWVIGTVDTHDVPVRQLADRVPAVVVSVEYRLAPEHPFPAAPDDCYAATAWVADNIGQYGGDGSRLAVGGDSAGGNLAAVVAQMARDRGGPAIAYQLLIYPAVDARMTSASITENGDGYLLTKGFMEWFYGHYLPKESDADDPLASPARAESLAGLPPALVLTAEFDPLRDEGEAYAGALRKAGVDATAKRYDGMIHGFFQLGGVVDRSGELMDDCAAGLRAGLSAG